MLLVSEGNNLIMIALVFVIPEYANIYKEKGVNMLKYPVWMCVRGVGLKINLNSLQNFETKYQLLLTTLFIHFLYFSPPSKNKKGKKNTFYLKLYFHCLLIQNNNGFMKPQERQRMFPKSLHLPSAKKQKGGVPPGTFLYP